jgi:hypothetical protein
MSIFLSDRNAPGQPRAKTGDRAGMVVLKGVE